MTNDEKKAVLIAEMRLAGVPYQVVNYYRKYLFGYRMTYTDKPDYIGESDVRQAIEMVERGEDFASWIWGYGHHFEDSDNLPKDDEWAKHRRD